MKLKPMTMTQPIVITRHQIGVGSSMVKIETCTYKPLTVRRQHASNMKIIVASLFGILVLTGITGDPDDEPPTRNSEQFETVSNNQPVTGIISDSGKSDRQGHLFSRRQTSPSSPTSGPGPHHEALAKLIRTSEDALGWIGNKTIDSIKNIKNLTASAVTPESPLVAKKNQIFNWLRGVAHYNHSTSGAESSATEAPEDSGESIVIAHRTPGQGFSWGSPREVDDEPSGQPPVAGGREPGVLSYLYQASRNITRRGKDIILSGIDKVKSAKESLKNKLFKNSGKHQETVTAASAQDQEKVTRVCGVDWPRGVFAIFPSGYSIRTYNRRHGTNFSIHDSEVCVNLFTHHPENYEKIENHPE